MEEDAEKWNNDTTKKNMLDWKKKKSEEIIVFNQRTSYRKKKWWNIPKGLSYWYLLTRENKILSKRKERRKEKQTKQLWSYVKKAFKKLRETKK